MYKCEMCNDDVVREVNFCETCENLLFPDNFDVGKDLRKQLIRSQLFKGICNRSSKIPIKKYDNSNSYELRSGMGNPLQYIFYKKENNNMENKQIKVSVSDYMFYDENNKVITVLNQITEDNWIFKPSDTMILKLSNMTFNKDLIDYIKNNDTISKFIISTLCSDTPSKGGSPDRITEEYHNVKIISIEYKSTPDEIASYDITLKL